MLAIIEAYRAGLLKKSYWWPNLIAGIIVAIVALPLAMAFAIASGVKPEQGLYTAIIAAFIVALMGGSRVQIAGPTGAFIVVLASITAHYGIEGLQIATFMAGILLVLLGCLKFGNVIKFIPHPVIIGFTSGIGVIIFVGEWKDFFGLNVKLPLDAPFHVKLIELINMLAHLNVTTTALACLSLFLVLITPKLLKRIPGALVAMLIVTALSMHFHFSNVATIGSTFGAIPQHLPPFHWPHLSYEKFLQLFTPACTIALLGAIESLLSAVAADNMAGTRHHANQELIGQGFANIIVPLFNGFAATGAIARTATNIRSGGNSPLAAIVHSLMLTLILLLLAPLAIHIPLCTLAAILFVVSYKMSDFPRFIHILKYAPAYDASILCITFLLTIFVNLIVAVNIGLILSLLCFMWRMHQSVDIVAELAPVVPSPLPAQTFIYSIRGPLFFGVADKIEQALTPVPDNLTILIFRLAHVPFMDNTGLETFHKLLQKYHSQGVTIYICEANETVSRKLKRMNCLAYAAKARIFATLAEIIETIKNH